NAGSGLDTWILIGGPLALVLVIVGIYAVVIRIRNRREIAELRQEEERLSAGLPGQASDEQALDDDDSDAHAAGEVEPTPLARPAQPP
ncbi:hypothetical protein ACXYUI_29525, partial [Klebsiella pneumoniae]